MRKVTTNLVSDLSGVEADDVRSVPFSFGKKDYWIDLTEAEYLQFAAVIMPYTDAAQPASSRAQKSARSTASRERSAEIRAWAQQQGIAIGPLGRIPGEIVAKYDAR